MRCSAASGAGDEVRIRMAMPAQLVRADDRVESDRGRAALMRGPIVYCLESHDNRGRVRDVWLPERASITSDWRPELLGGVTILRAAAERLPLGGGKPFETEVVAIPYYANANRGPAEMIVWVPTTPAGATPPDDRVPFHSDSLSLLRQRHRGCDERRRRAQEFVGRDAQEVHLVGPEGNRRVGTVRLRPAVPGRRHERLLVGRRSTRPPLRRADELAAGLPQAGRHMGACPSADEFGTKLDTANTVEFEPVETTALRIEVKPTRPVPRARRSSPFPLRQPLTASSTTPWMR